MEGRALNRIGALLACIETKDDPMQARAEFSTSRIPPKPLFDQALTGTAFCLRYKIVVAVNPHNAANISQ